MSGLRVFLRFFWGYLSFFVAVALGIYGIFYPAFWDNITDYFAKSGMSMQSFVRGLIFFMAILYLTKIIKHLLGHQILTRVAIDEGVKSSLVAIVGYVGTGLGIAVALSIMGLNMKNLAIVVGALSVGIGFGLQNIVNNFISGIVILFERPIKVGDWVVVKQNEGIVRRINIRSTELETFNKAAVLIPNADIISNDLINWTHADSFARVDVKIGVAYNSDVKLVKEILLYCADREPAVLKKPAPYVLFMNFGDNSLDFQLRCVVKNVMEKLTVQSNLMFAIFEEFNKAKVEIPFPQRVIHFVNDSEPQKSGSGLSRAEEFERMLTGRSHKQ